MIDLLHLPCVGGAHYSGALYCVEQWYLYSWSTLCSESYLLFAEPPFSVGVFVVAAWYDAVGYHVVVVAVAVAVAAIAMTFVNDVMFDVLALLVSA